MWVRHTHQSTHTPTHTHTHRRLSTHTQKLTKGQMQTVTEELDSQIMHSLEHSPEVREDPTSGISDVGTKKVRLASKLGLFQFCLHYIWLSDWCSLATKIK